MAAATESPPHATGVFQFNDDMEYPPLNQKSDWDWAADQLLRGNGYAVDEWRIRYQLMFCTVIFIHFVVRVSEKLILYLLDMNE